MSTRGKRAIEGKEEGTSNPTSKRLKGIQRIKNAEIIVSRNENGYNVDLKNKQDLSDVIKNLEREKIELEEEMGVRQKCESSIINFTRNV